MVKENANDVMHSASMKPIGGTRVIERTWADWGRFCLHVHERRMIASPRKDCMPKA